MKRLIFSLTTCFVLLFGLSVSAYEPGICDPNEDPDQCDCPASGDYDVCYDTLTVDDLDSLGSPSAIRDLANIQTTWNSDDGVYEVTIDTSGLSGGGVVLPDYETNGNWDTFSDLHVYLSELLGVELTPQDYDGDGVDDFPPLRIYQEGKVSVYDSQNERWAPSQSGMLVWDAITAMDGTLTIDGSVFDMMPDGQRCNGDDEKSYLKVNGENVDADECSFAGYNLDAETSVPDCVENGVPCVSFPRVAKTRLNTLGANWSYERTVRCVGSFNSNGTLVCDNTLGFVVTAKRSDELYLKNDYWNRGSYEGDIGDTRNDIDAFKLGEPQRDGVCALGEATENGETLTLQTRDGGYDSADQSCDF